MLYVWIIVICSEIHEEHRNTLCGQKLKFIIVKPCGMYSNRFDLNGYKLIAQYLRSIVSVRNFRLPPRCKWGLRSSGILRSVQW